MLDNDRVVNFLDMPRDVVMKLIKDKKWRSFDSVVKYTNSQEYRDYIWSKKVKLEAYQENMKVKYEKLLSSIDSELLSVGSFQRGELLYEVLFERVEIPQELKYYIFVDWYSSIDAGHQLFEAEDIEEWMDEVNVKLDYKKLNPTKKGLVKVYRGINEYSNPNGLSWTTDKEVAVKFANGCRVRGAVKEPKVLEGEVYCWNILAMFWDREESEILCEIY